MGLKEQAISGVLWNSIGKFSSMAIEFVVGIVLARLLTPKEFGLIGTIMVVIALSQVFINSGFSQALIRKQNCTQEDYSTVFFFNIAVGLFLFATLVISSGFISRFYNNPELKPLLQVLAIGLIISSFTIIQSAKLTKRIDFKLQTKISVIASVVSGIIAILMALKGFGVWSLVVKSLTNQIINSVLLWYSSHWKPDLVFSVTSFKELFGFGSKLLLSGLIGTFFTNIYYIAIGKYFPVADLGFYTRAELFKNLPSQNVEGIVTAVGFPVLAKVQHDRSQLKTVFQRIITATFFIVAMLMFGMAAVAHSLVITLVGLQWTQSIVYLQLLCFTGLLYPLNSLNVNLLNVVGRSDLYMKKQLILQLTSIPVIFVGLKYGIIAMIIGININSLIGLIIYANTANKFSGYSLKEQLFDITPTIIIGGIMGVVVFFVGFYIHMQPFTTLLIQISIGGIMVIILSLILKNKDFYFLKGILSQQTQRRLNYGTK